MTKNILISIIIVVCCILISCANAYEKDRKARANFYERDFHGVIKEIKYNEGRRGFPDIKLTNEWIYLGLSGQKIQNYILVDDSIVKDSGTETIKVYRKNSKGIWDEKVFK